MAGPAFDYVAGGAWDEITLRGSVEAWGRHRFVPRVLRDVSETDIGGTFLGRRAAMPVAVAWPPRGLPTRTVRRSSSPARPRPAFPTASPRPVDLPVLGVVPASIVDKVRALVLGMGCRSSIPTEGSHASSYGQAHAVRQTAAGASDPGRGLGTRNRGGDSRLARRRLRVGPHRLGPLLGHPRSTVYGVLRRHGQSRLAHADRLTGAPVRYVRDRPGELVHVDVKKLGRVPPGGGHRLLGPTARNHVGLGHDFLHVAVDNASRVALSRRCRTSGRRPPSPSSRAP